MSAGLIELLIELKASRAAADLIFYRMPFTMVDDLIEALDAAHKREVELVECLEGVIRVADRKTDEFDAAHRFLARVRSE